DREVAQHPATVVARRPLAERALQVGDRGVRRALLGRVGRRTAQQLADRRVALRAAAQQVAGDGVGAGAGVHERPGRLAVEALAAAIRLWAKRSPSASSRPAASNASRAGRSSRTSTRATAEMTTAGAPSPITASASATARSRGCSAAIRWRTTLRAIAVTRVA